MSLQDAKELFEKECPPDTRVLVFENRTETGKFIKRVVKGKPFITAGTVRIALSGGETVDISRVSKDPEVEESDPHTYRVIIIFHDGDDLVKCFNTEYAPTTDQIISGMDLHDIDTITVYRKEKRLKIKQQISEE